MAITIYPPLAVALRKRSGAESLPVAAGASASAVRHTSGNSVWSELDRLFAALADSVGLTPVVERGRQTFEEAGTFTVPAGVHRILVMCIAAGSAPTYSGRYTGNTLVSRYLDVTPGTSYAVTISTSKTGTVGTGNRLTGSGVQGSSSFGGNLLKAGWSGQYTVDGTTYTYNWEQDQIFPEALAGKGMCSISRMIAPPTGHGTGGWRVWNAGGNADLSRAYWLELARDIPAGAGPSGRPCYPDTSQLAQAATNDSGNAGWRVGAGAYYGGPAGKFQGTYAYAANSRWGGPGCVMVFWGDDISRSSRTLWNRWDADSSLPTPIVPLTLAEELPYTNPGAGFTGSTVGEALDEIARRLESAGTV